MRDIVIMIVSTKIAFFRSLTGRSALGDVSDSAKTAIDTLVTGVYRCGSSLSDS